MTNEKSILTVLQKLLLGIRPLNTGHPRVTVVITDGKSINAEKT